MDYIDIKVAKSRIRRGLEERTGRKWSVTVHPGRHTWLVIAPPPSRRVCPHLAAPKPPFGHCASGSCVNGSTTTLMQQDDLSMLTLALGLWVIPHYERRGVVVYPLHRKEFIERAEGRR